MDDKFLYQLQEIPDPGFVRALHENLEQKRSVRGRRKPSFLNAMMSGKKLVRVTAALVVALLAVTIFSPVRALVLSLMKSVGGQIFEVTEDFPGDDYPGGATVVRPQVMALDDALGVFPYPIHLPKYIPTGFRLNERNVLVYVGEDAVPFANTIELQWLAGDGSGLDLKITDIDGEIIAPDSAEEVWLNDQHSAVLIRGGWGAEQKIWKDDFGYRLIWSMEQLNYHLSGVDREQLMEIAVSTIP